jgi:23S rRNA (guanosine2251-2'-O)-methyltransferase
MPRRDRRHFHSSPPSKAAEGLWLYGLHAVRAALANPARKTKRAVLTARAADEIGPKLLARLRPEIVETDAVAKLLPPGAVHQGAALQCEPLPRRDLEALLSSASPGRRLAVVLDQISDPQNTGAILRTAAAFGAICVIAQDRHAPPESGALAKAASGALDIVPYAQVVNISRALDQLGEMGFWRIALAGDGESPLKDAIAEGDVALVLGSEGSGIRRLVRERCDAAAFIPIDRSMDSLNVSSAAAIALYEVRRS